MNYFSDSDQKNEISCLKDTIEKILLQKSVLTKHQYQNDQAVFLQIETASESNDDFYPSTESATHKQYNFTNQLFGSMNRQSPMLLDNDASKAKSSLIKRGSLALRQPPQQPQTKLDDVDFISNENSNMLFNSRETHDDHKFINK